jgi:hypothetical protein
MRDLPPLPLVQLRVDDRDSPLTSARDRAKRPRGDALMAPFRAPDARRRVLGRAWFELVGQLHIGEQT